MQSTNHRSAFRFVSSTLAGLGVVVTALSSQAAAQSCGDTLGPGGQFQLTADIGPCDDDAGPALTVNSAVLDLNGFTITCADTDMDLALPNGIEAVGAKAIIVNGTVTGCDRGVVLAGTGKHRVGLVEVTASESDGFQVDSDKNILALNSAGGNGENGFQVDGDGNALFQNVADGSGDFDGIEVNGERNKLLVNACTNNDHGFDIHGARTTMVSNLAGNNRNGFFVHGPDSKLVRNTAVANIEYGFHLAPVTGGLKFVKNFASSNSGSGILLNMPADAIVKAVKNESIDNHIVTGFDIEDLTPGCGSHVWKKNDFDTASDACIQ